MNSDLENLSPADIAAWFRTQARRYNDRADEIERDYGLSSCHHSDISPIKSAQNGLLERVKQYLLARGARRPQHLAVELGIPEKQIRSLCKDPESGLEIRSRGWVYPIGMAPRRGSGGDEMED